MLFTDINVMLLGWECLFCLVAAVSMMEGQYSERKGWLIRLQLTAALLLACDAIGCYYDGRPGTTIHWVLVVADLANFLLMDSVLLLFHRYLCCSLLKAGERQRLGLVKAVELVCLGAMALVVVSQFTEWYYHIDETNHYIRGPLYPLSLALPFAGLVMDGVLLLQYRERVSRRLFRVMAAYFLLPLVAAVAQLFSYGLSLIDLSVGAAMLLIYLIVNREQQAELRRVQEERAVVAQRLEIAQTLNRCVEKLSSGEDISTAIRDLLWIIKEYFQADRAYIFENDPVRRVTVNTYESVEPGVEPQIENLQEVPMDVISMWMKQFRRGKKYFIANIEQEKGTPHYRIIKDQGIQRLLTVPLLEQGQVIGFLGVDNPQRHFEDETLLSSLQFFVTNSLRQKKEQEYLQQLSFTDQLTGLYNRNRYNRTLQFWQEDCQNQVGILYIDLNGLKQTNDSRGHAAGDKLIRDAAGAMEQIFPGQAYRIGGDEFVVICQGIPEPEFRAQAEQLSAQAGKKGISLSMGLLWTPQCPDLSAALKEADARMYEEKRKYHEKRG